MNRSREGAGRHSSAAGATVRSAPTDKKKNQRVRLSDSETPNVVDANALKLTHFWKDLSKYIRLILVVLFSTSLLTSSNAPWGNALFAVLSVYLSAVIAFFALAYVYPGESSFIFFPKKREA
jgi:hypothetical protein